MSHSYVVDDRLYINGGGRVWPEIQPDANLREEWGRRLSALPYLFPGIDVDEIISIYKTASLATVEALEALGRKIDELIDCLKESPLSSILSGASQIPDLEAQVRRLQQRLIATSLDDPTERYNWDDDSMPYDPEGPFPSSP